MLDLNTVFWTTIHSLRDQNFGTMGVGAANVFPGTLAQGACAITSLDKQFSMFGGAIAPWGMNNDMWSHDFHTGQWKWVKGDYSMSSGYSVGKGIEAPSNIPSLRFGHTMNAQTSSNNLLVFGGYRVGFGLMNDLWRFNVSSLCWTWIAGDMSTGDSPANYGTPGVSGPLNNPFGMYFIVPTY